MKDNQKLIFCLNGLPKCKSYFSASMMFFLLYAGLEKAIQVFGLTGWIFGIPRWWVLGSGLTLALASLTYFGFHKKLTLAIVEEESITYLWGMLWNRKKLEIACEVVEAADFGFIHKKWLVRAPNISASADFGSEEKVIKIVLKEPVNSALVSPIQALKKQWWDGFIKASKTGTEIYLREEPYGGYEPLLTQIRKHVE